VALPAVAVAAPAVPQSIDISCQPGPQQQTRRTLLQLANGIYRYTNPAAYTTEQLCTALDHLLAIADDDDVCVSLNFIKYSFYMII